MKIVNFIVPASSTSEMNNLVDAICKIVAKEDPARLRDKFKMVDMATPEKIMHLCEHLKLDVKFLNSGKVPEISVPLSVKDSFDWKTFENNPEVEESTEEKTPPVEEAPALIGETKEVLNPPQEENFVSVTAEESSEEVAPPEDLGPETDLNNDDDGDDDFPF